MVLGTVPVPTRNLTSACFTHSLSAGAFWTTSSISLESVGKPNAEGVPTSNVNRFDPHSRFASACAAGDITMPEKTNTSKLRRCGQCERRGPPSRKHFSNNRSGFRDARRNDPMVSVGTSTDSFAFSTPPYPEIVRSRRSRSSCHHCLGHRSLRPPFFELVEVLQKSLLQQLDRHRDPRSGNKCFTKFGVRNAILQLRVVTAA